MPKPSEQPQSKKTISDAQLRSELIKLFEKGETGKTDLYGLLRTKHKMGRDRYFQAYDTAMNEWQKVKERTTNEQVQANTIDGLKSGLKSKLERQLHLQKQIDDIQMDIDKGILEDYVVVGGKLQVVNKIMNAETKAYLRKTIKELTAELNKMDGSYSPTKSEVILFEAPQIIAPGDEPTGN